MFGVQASDSCLGFLSQEAREGLDMGASDPNDPKLHVLTGTISN